jgi:glutamate-1-semialdehyde 2,1-aminomutase
VLRLLERDSYDRLEQIAASLVDGLAAALDKAGLTAQCRRAWTLGGLFFGGRTVTNYDDAKKADHATYARVFHGLLERGVFFPPSGYEALFPSLAHTDDDLASVLDAVTHVASTLEHPNLRHQHAK